MHAEQLQQREPPAGSAITSLTCWRRGHDVVAISRPRRRRRDRRGSRRRWPGWRPWSTRLLVRRLEEGPATEFFTASARNLQTLGERAGVQRIVVVSIIGIDRFTVATRPCQAHERTLLAGLIPLWTLRAAQFHEFVPELVNWGRQDGVSYLPKMRTQLVAARSVAEALADLATLPDSDPAGTDGSTDPGDRRSAPGEPRRDGATARRPSRRSSQIESVVDSRRQGELLANGALLPGAACHPRWPELRGVASRET